jgi:hypothetical protein
MKVQLGKNQTPVSKNATCNPTLVSYAHFHLTLFMHGVMYATASLANDAKMDSKIAPICLKHLNGAVSFECR